MNYQELNGHSIREEFNRLNAENPHVYAEFERQALNVIAKGLTRNDLTVLGFALVP
jgi:hypothetical protein